MSLISCISRTTADKNEWIEAINSAQEEYRHRKESFADGAMACQPTTPQDAELGDEAPPWVPDGRVTMCMLCNCDFTMLVRKHHCRTCGKVVCGKCSANKAPIKFKQYAVDRVCTNCFEKLRESKFMFSYVICEWSLYQF